MLQNKRLAYLLFLLFTMITMSCENTLGGTQSLQIENRTEQRLYFWYSRDYTVHHFPDTLLPTLFPIQIGEIAPNNSAGTGSINPNWDNIFAELSDNTFSIYYFDSKPANQVDWDLLISNPENYNRKDFTHQELKENNYLISIP